MQTKPPEVEAELADRTDAWINVLAGMRGTREKSQGIQFALRQWLTPEVLASMYGQEAMAAVVVDQIVDDAMREGLPTIKGADDPIDLKAVATILDDLCVATTLTTADKWSRLFGGALLVAPTTDYDPITGEVRKPHEPMGIVTSLHKPYVVPAQKATPLEWDDVWGSPTYHKVLSYQIDGDTGQSTILHHSRCHVFEPIKLPPEALRAGSSRGWGPSVIERVIASMSGMGASLQHLVSQMYIASLLTLHLKGYREDHRSDKGRDKLRKYLTDLFAMLDSRGMTAMDSEDRLASTQQAMTAAPLAVEKTREAFAAAARIPKEILFRESPAGLNAGELSGPQAIWFGDCASHRKDVLNPALDWLLAIVFQVHKIAAREWQYEWADLWTPSETSKATNAKTWADVDVAYNGLGLDGDEIIRQRFVDGRVGALELEGPSPPNPMEITPEDLAAAEAATTPAPAAEATTPADLALNGAQGDMLLNVIEKMNTGAITYEQATGSLGIMFPQMRGREATVLGPKPAVAPVSPAAAAPPAPAADTPDPMNGPSDDPIPDDVVSPREAADKYRVSTRTITRMMEKLGADGKPIIRHWGLGSHVRVSLADIARAARAHEVPTEDPADGEA